MRIFAAGKISLVYNFIQFLIKVNEVYQLLPNITSPVMFLKGFSKIFCQIVTSFVLSVIFIL